MVLNGNEIGGGSIRIFQRELQEKMFAALGMSKEEAFTNLDFCWEPLNTVHHHMVELLLALTVSARSLAAAKAFVILLPFQKTMRVAMSCSMLLQISIRNNWMNFK